MPFDKVVATTLLNSAFAQWVQSLDLLIENIERDRAILRMRFSEKLCRDNGVVCGQALMSFADTSMVFAISAAAGGYGRSDHPFSAARHASRFAGGSAGRAAGPHHGIRQRFNQNG